MKKHINANAPGPKSLKGYRRRERGEAIQQGDWIEDINEWAVFHGGRFLITDIVGQEFDYVWTKKS